jgi:hypothetical protein
MTFGECVIACSQSRELLENFDRLRGTNMSQIGRVGGIAAAIDECTGRNEDSMAKFCAFVYECVWTRIDWSR